MSAEMNELDIEQAYHAVSDTYLGSAVDIHGLCRDKRLTTQLCVATS